MNMLRAVIIIAVVGSIISSCSRETKTVIDKDQSVVSERAVVVKSLIVGDEKDVIYRNFPVVVQPHEEAQLAFRVSGQLKALLVKSGAYVQKGDVLAELDDRNFQIDVDLAKAHYKLASAQHKRIKTLHDQKLLSASRFSEADAEFKTAKAKLDSAELNLKFTKLIAPFDGQISRRAVDNFANVVAGQETMSLLAIDKVDLSVQVSEQMFANLKETSKYQPEVFFNANQGVGYRAALKEYELLSDPVTQTYRVVFSMDMPPSFKVVPGMSATLKVNSAEVLTDLDRKIQIPSSAVMGANDVGSNESYVWIVDKNYRLKKRRVVLGRINRDQIVIKEGLTYGERFVSAGVHRLNEGALTKIWKKQGGI